MFKKILKITPLFFVAAFFCFAEEGEKITITTYYPSPHGVYNEMKTRKLIVGDIEGDSPERGVIRFESLNSPPEEGEKGDLCFDSGANKFKYYDGFEWKAMMGGIEGQCGWFRGSQCPQFWTQEGDPIKASDFPITVEGYKAVYYKTCGLNIQCGNYGHPGPGFWFKCKANSGCSGEPKTKYPGVNSAVTACKRCFGDQGFVGVETLPNCSCFSYGQMFVHNSVLCDGHVRCLYQGDAPTPPLMAEYTLYYCCPPDE